MSTETSKLSKFQETIRKSKKASKKQQKQCNEIPKTTGEIECLPSFDSFEWKIKNYFELSQEIDFCLYSPPLNVYDATWSILLFPNGRSGDPNPGYMSLCLRKDSNASKHHMRFTIGLKVQDGSEMRSDSMDHEFNENDTTCGWYNFFKVEDLKEKSDEIAPKGVLTVFCNMKPHEYDGLQKLGQNFKDLLRTGEASDVTIYIKDRQFKVHRAVLVARMPVFSALMTRDVTGNSNWVIKIDDCDPDVFQQFLTYLYTGQVDILSANTIFSFHSIAEKYNENDLIRNCIQYMIKHLSSDKFCDVLSLILKHEDMDLLEDAVKYFANNLAAILKSVKWQSFFKEDPLKANEIYKKAKDYIKENE